MTALPPARRSVTPALVALVALVVGACSGPPFGGTCTDELRIRLSPVDTTVAVGASFQARVSLTTCGGSKRLSDTFTWASRDPTVVQVIASTGQATAMESGQTVVNVTGARYGSVGEIRVVVTP